MTLPLTGHVLVEWPAIGSRPAYGNETDWFTTRHYGCACGAKFGEMRSYIGQGHADLSGWFTQHLLTVLGAGFRVTEITLEEAVGQGLRKEPTKHELTIRGFPQR